MSREQLDLPGFRGLTPAPPGTQICVSTDPGPAPIPPAPEPPPVPAPVDELLELDAQLAEATPDAPRARPRWVELEPGAAAGEPALAGQGT